MKGHIPDTAAKAAERFLHLAAVLPEGETLTWQFDTSAANAHAQVIFAGADSGITEADMRWALGVGADIRPMPDTDADGANAQAGRRNAKSDDFSAADVSPDGRFHNGRKIYALVSDGQHAKHASPETANRIGDLLGDPWYNAGSDAQTNAYAMLAEAGAVIRLTADPLSTAIRISLPDEMTLRTRGALFMAFSLVCRRADEDGGADADRDTLTGRDFLDTAISLMNDCLQAASDYKPDAADIPHAGARAEDDLSVPKVPAIQNGNWDPDDPIDVLGLSVRAYNCLRRGGVQTIAQLRALSDEELLSFRNLREKSLAEIRRIFPDRNGIKDDRDADADGLDDADADDAADADNDYDSDDECEAYEDSYAPVMPGARTGRKHRAGKADAMTRLDGMIGLDDVKKQIRRIAAYAKMKKDLESARSAAEPLVLNMAFVGNPGTAKTTVARLAAGIFHEAGLLAQSEPVETGRADLVGRYAGETAQKVQRIFQNTHGRLLFIDEAYALAEHWEGGYGDEAINTLVQEMENRRGETIVILAGYPKEMDAFLARNPGLRSRVPFTVRFPDYTAEEMCAIAEREAQRRGFSVDPQAAERIRALCERAEGNPAAGNGRFCRNLIDSAILEYAWRVYGGAEEEKAERNRVLLAEDFRECGVPLQPAGKRAPIGFGGTSAAA